MRFRLLPLEPPAGLASEYERPCIMTAFMPLAMEKDLRCDLMATGSGSLSMRWTGVHDTMALQQRSCRLKTAEENALGVTMTTESSRKRGCSAPRELTSVGPPELLHAVPHQHDARQLGERLDDVEVAQRTHLEERHPVLLGVGSRLLGGDLPLEGQVQTVAHEDPRHTRSMLGKKETFLTTEILSEPSAPGKKERENPKRLIALALATLKVCYAT